MERGGGVLRLAVLAVALCASGAATAVGIASASGSPGTATARVGTLELSVGADFGPRVRPRRTPIRLGLAGRIRDPGAPDRHPSAIRELQLESAGLEVHTGGIPVCRAGQLQATESEAAEKACGSALIGAGSAMAQVAFAEQKPIDVKGRLLVFNGGREGDETTLYLHTYFPNPISGAIVTRVTVTKPAAGQFGTLAVAKIPQITGGSGSIIGFHLTIDRNVRGNNPVSATCRRGQVRAYVEGEFEDGAKAATEIVRGCRAKG